MTREQRFWNKVEVGDDCWEWLGARTGAGYGNFCLGKVEGKKKYTPAHRFAYEDMIESIPSGLHIDHLCRNRACVNPWHLDVVTNRENAQRGLRGRMVTRCVRGHEYTEENTIIDGPHTSRPGRRRCRTCTNERRKFYPSYR